MSMFKNASLLKIGNEFLVTSEQLEQSMQPLALKPCGEFQRESVGWDTPVKGGEQLVHTVGDYMLIKMAILSRILPASVVRDEVEERVTEIQERERRRVGAKEKRELRENVEDELLPRAFVRTKGVYAYLDLKNRWLVVDSQSSKVLEQVAAMLRAGLGSFPATPPNTTVLPRELLTRWLADGDLLVGGDLPEGFNIGDCCEIHGVGDDKSVALYRNHDLAADDVTSSIQDGGMVASLGLVWDDKISFILNETLTIKGIKFLSTIIEQLDEQDIETAVEQLDAEFSLMAGEFGQLLGQLMPCFCKPEEIAA